MWKYTYVCKLCFIVRESWKIRQSIDIARALHYRRCTRLPSMYYYRSRHVLDSATDCLFQPPTPYTPSFMATSGVAYNGRVCRAIIPQGGLVHFFRTSHATLRPLSAQSRSMEWHHQRKSWGSTLEMTEWVRETKKHWCSVWLPLVVTKIKRFDRNVWRLYVCVCLSVFHSLWLCDFL